MSTNPAGPGDWNSSVSAILSALAVLLVGVHQGDDAFQVVERGELDGDLPLGLAEVDLDAGFEAVGETVGQVDEAGGDRLVAAALRRRRVIAVHVAQGNDLLDGADREALGKTKGKITVEFASLDDLERIVTLMDPNKQDSQGA